MEHEMPLLGRDGAPAGGTSPGGSAAGAAGPPAIRRIEDLPKEVGVMLVSVGAVGVVLPGMMGAPALIAGGLVLWPRTFGPLEDWFRRRNPRLYHRGMQQVSRFLDDLERRYPDLRHK